MTEVVPAWINRTGRSWGLAHVLRTGSTHEFRGAEYARTMCGRIVRADQIEAAGREDRCNRCLVLSPAQTGPS